MVIVCCSILPIRVHVPTGFRNTWALKEFVYVLEGLSYWVYGHMVPHVSGLLHGIMSGSVHLFEKGFGLGVSIRFDANVGA